MSPTMTCWKEIAQYLSKGVRTAQRWEQEMGLPVRRPHGRKTGVVLADSDEIDVWLHSRCEAKGKSDFEILRSELAKVKKQNQLLLAKLEYAERAANFVRLNKTADVEHWMDEVLRKRCSQAIEKNNAIRQRSMELIDRAQNMQAILRKQGEQEDLKLSRPH